MPDEWFYSRNEQKQGPVSVAQLKQLASSGQLLPTDLIWKRGMPLWVPASSAKGLFQADQPPPIPVSLAPLSPVPVVMPVAVTRPRISKRKNQSGLMPLVALLGVLGLVGGGAFYLLSDRSGRSRAKKPRQVATAPDRSAQAPAPAEKTTGPSEAKPTKKRPDEGRRPASSTPPVMPDVAIPAIPDVGALVAGATDTVNRLNQQAQDARRNPSSPNQDTTSSGRESVPAGNPSVGPQGRGPIQGGRKPPPENASSAVPSRPASLLTAQQRVARDRAYAPPPVPVLTEPTRVLRPKYYENFHPGTPISVQWSPDGMAVAVQEERGETQVFDATSGETIFPTDQHRRALTKGLPQDKGIPQRYAPLRFTPDITARAKDFKDAQWSAIAANVPWRLCFSQDEFLVSEHFVGYGLSIVAASRAPKWDVVRPQFAEPWAAPLIAALDKFVQEAQLTTPNMKPTWPAAALAPRKLCIPANGWAIVPTSPHLVTHFGSGLYLWNLQSGEGSLLCEDCIATTRDNPATLVFSPNGRLLAVYLSGKATSGAHGAHELQIWETESWKLVSRTKKEGTLREPLDDNLSPLAFSPDNARLLCSNGTVRDVATNEVLAALDWHGYGGGAGWASDSLHFCVMDHYVVPDTAGRYEGDIFIYNWQTERLAIRLRHDMASRATPGQLTERLGKEGEMVMGLSSNGKYLGVCSEDRLCTWDVPKDILSAVVGAGDYPKGDGSEEHPLTVTPADLHAAFLADEKAATKAYVGKWVAMPSWRMKSFEPYTTEKPGHFLITLKNEVGGAGIKAYVPFEYRQHRQRLDDPLKPPFIGLVQGTSRAKDGALLVDVVECDIISSTPDLKEAEMVPDTPAPPITLAQYQGLKKGMTMEDVKKLLGGTGEEKWDEVRTKAKSQSGQSLSYDEVSQRITVTYSGQAPGSRAVLVFQGEKQLQYRLVEATQNGLE